MRTLTIDFETFWTSDYTLSKLSTEEYIRDPRFKTHMVGIKNGDNPTVIVPGHQAQAVFSKIDWSDTAVLCQHAHFDGLILSYHYGVKPAFWLDTLSMFRAIYPAESAALSNQVEVLGLPAKGGGFYNIVSTKDKETLTIEEYNACAGYCKTDCDLTKRSFDILKKHFPISELKLIDLTIRMFTEPILELEHELLIESWHDERQATLALFQAAMPELADAAYDAIENNDPVAWKKLKTPLSSNPQFAQMLLNLGVDPPKKLSPAAVKKGDVHPDVAGDPPLGMLPTTRELKEYLAKTGEEHPDRFWAYAFGKSDEAFKLMLQSEDTALVTLVEARLGVKSTIKETRAQRFIGIASRGAFPIYLKYYGAHTGRYGGGDKVNPQNLNKFCPACSGEGKI
jgi:hypothetical protein